MQSKPRLLWISIKMFDTAVGKAPYLEVGKYLQNDFDVHLLTGWREKPKRILVGKNPVIYFSQFGKGLIQKFSRTVLLKHSCKKAIGTLKPDLVFLTCPNNVGLVQAISHSCARYCIPIVLDIRTLPTSVHHSSGWRQFRKCVSYASRHYSGISYITMEMFNYCIREYSLPEHKHTIWTSGVNPSLFALGTDETNLDGFRIIYHGGIIAACRGLDNLIRAIDLVRDLNPKLTLISSLREPDTISLIQTLGLRDHINLVDTQPHEDIPEYIQENDIGILPFPDHDAWNTSSPLKLFEYMSCGKPVVVTDIPAHRHVLDGRPFAFFAKDNSPAELAKAIRSAHAFRNMYAEWGAMARTQVLNQHTWKHQTTILSEFLMSFLH